MPLIEPASAFLDLSDFISVLLFLILIFTLSKTNTGYVVSLLLATEGLLYAYSGYIQVNAINEANDKLIHDYCRSFKQSNDYEEREAWSRGVDDLMIEYSKFHIDLFEPIKMTKAKKIYYAFKDEETFRRVRAVCEDF